ncbi:T9SS type A sorting domain-containing protein [Flavobacteriaceae bacterium]|nr:T9SS type A sorting domain-containing protein [Flavobacteriaceae bacterium]MDC1540316.1 T9SS type A sorting domain-containing protein [Flavobacteriaceae bacterium]
MRKPYILSLVLVLGVSFFYYYSQNPISETTPQSAVLELKTSAPLKSKKKTESERQMFAQERLLYELNMQKNPLTGTVTMEEKQQELENTLLIKQEAQRRRRIAPNTYTSRGPSNLGGRTRALAVDLSDNTGNTMLSGGVSSGLFRTTDGGVSWTKVSANDEIHNVTALVQDPRAGHQNKWYYATGEWSGNSASLGSAYRGRGVWQSTNSGLTWTQIPGTNSVFENYDSDFDYISALEVNPITGHLFIATNAINKNIYRYDGTSFTKEFNINRSGWTDVVIATNGRVFASLEGSGVWTSPTGNGSWTLIAKNAVFDADDILIENAVPLNWASSGRIVLGEAPSNTDVIYALYVNGDSGNIEADLWKYDLSTDTWTDYSSKLPDEPAPMGCDCSGDLAGNDPFAVQGGYDLVVSVKPDNENFVLIGGTNVYRIEDITTDATFTRIGGYVSNTSYAPYSVGGVEHHSDIHVLEFDPFDVNTLFSGTDGGVHKTLDITAANIAWASLNNNYITYQFYHVALDPTTGSNFVFGGTQDNGTKFGGTDSGLPDNTSMNHWWGGDGVAVGIGTISSRLQLYFGSQNGNIHAYDDGYRADIKPTGSPTGKDALFITYFYLDPDNNDYLYYAGKPTLYKTATATTVVADTWDNAGTLSTNENLRTFATTRGAYDAASSYMLIGGESGGIFRFDDPVNTANLNAAVNITPAAANKSKGAVVSGLAIHPTNKDIVLAVYANYGINSIFLTTNATAANPDWTLVEQNLSAHSIRSAAVTTVGNEIIYFVGTARGLYSNSDPVNDNWVLEGPNTIGLAVVSSLVYRPSDNTLLIGTHGNGMFETTVQGTLSTNDFTKTTDVYVYPNPTQDVLNFRSTTLDFSATVTYEIYNLTGKRILNGTLNNQKVDVRPLNSGVYFVNLNIGNTTQSLKFIKN